MEQSSSVAELAKNSEDIETDVSKVADHQEYAEALSMSGRSRTKRRWNRRTCCTREVLSGGAIFIALLLVIGAIYMHLRQKHHLGRLHINLKDRGRLDVLEEDFPVVTVAAVDNFISGLHCWVAVLSLSLFPSRLIRNTIRRTSRSQCSIKIAIVNKRNQCFGWALKYFYFNLNSVFHNVIVKCY
nr:uncharacterized protein LOC108005894 isoform X2 [Drosophila suzukii]